MAKGPLWPRQFMGGDAGASFVVSQFVGAVFAGKLITSTSFIVTLVIGAILRW